MICRKLILVLAFSAGVCVAAPSAPKGAPVEIVSAEFGIFNANNPNELVFEPAVVVPHRQGQRYGWAIEVRTAKRSLNVSEEYLLPLPAKGRESSEHSVEDTTFQRRNQVSQRQLVPVDGKIYGEWAIGPNEPAGHRHLQVVVEGQVAARFEYDVK